MLTAPWIRGSGSPAWMIFVSKRCEGFAILMPSVLLMPHFLVFCEGFSLRPLPSLQHTRERGIHRSDAENFEFLFGPDKARESEHQCSWRGGGLQRRRSAQSNLSSYFSLRRCGEFPFGCGFAARCF